MDNEKLISIIIPCFNGEKYINRCLNSILKSSYTSYEIIVVNDGSTDNSLKILKEYNDNRIVIINSVNKGVAAARNLGLEQSQGDYITFIDVDDYVTKDYLYNLISKMKGDIDLVVTKATDVDEDNNIIFKYDYFIDEIIKVDSDFDFGGKNSHYVSWGCLYKKALIGGLRFDQNLFVGEDTLFYAKALFKSKKCCFIKPAGYYYVVRKSSALHGVVDDKKLTELAAWKKVSQEVEYNSNLWKSIMNQYAHRIELIFKKSEFKIKKKVRKIVKEEYNSLINYSPTKRKIKLFLIKNFFLMACILL